MSDELNARLGAVIRQRRALLGMSQDALGKKLGNTCQQVQKYEKGSNQVSFPRLVELAAALGFSVTELVTATLGEGSESPHAASDRETLELVKRWGQLGKRQRQGVRMLVQCLAEAG